MSGVRQDILVVCLVESSVALLHEWNDVLLTYVSPLLQRIASTGAAKGSRNELRIGFISYSDSYVHPNPILARRFFSPVIQLTKELKDDPASLGIGRTASGGRRGMAILEGYVAVIEMFDAVSETRPPPLRPHPPNEVQTETPPYEPACYLIHVASSPPDKSTRPSWNTNTALDKMSWASLPSELTKRKIRPSMILTRTIPELQDLHKRISRTPDPSWITLLKPCHKLLFAGLPPKDTKIIPQKRPASDNGETPQSSAPVRPSSQEQPVPVNPLAATSTPPASNSHSNSSPPRPGTVTSALPSIEPPSQVPTQAPIPPQVQPQPDSQSLVQPAPAAPNLDPAKLVSYIRTIENECRVKAAALNQARAAGTPQSELDAMQANLAQKFMNRQKLLLVFQQVMQRQQQGNIGVAQTQTATAISPQPPVSGQIQPVKTTQEPPDIHMMPPNASSSTQGTQVTQPQNIFTNFAVSTMANKNIPISARSGMEAQMQKMLAERTRPPVLAAAPQTQPQAQQTPQNSMQPIQTSPPPNMTQNQKNIDGNQSIADLMTPRASLGPHQRRWQGTLSWPSSAGSVGIRKENHLVIALFSQDGNMRTESWPQKLILQPSRCVLNMQQVQGWMKEFSPSMGLISPTPVVGNFEASAQNARLFRQLRDLVQHKSLLAYCKFDVANGPPGTGFLTFPSPTPSTQGDLLIALVFHRSPLPAALMAQPATNQVPSDPVSSTEAPAMTAGSGASIMQNVSSELTNTFLQQRQAAALVAYTQQQIAQQQAQQKGLVANAGLSAAGQGLAPGINVNQFLQSMQSMRQASGENQVGLGGLNLAQAPALQQTQHRQPSGFNAGQMGNLQAMQYQMNRRPDEGQGQ